MRPAEAWERFSGRLWRRLLGRRRLTSGQRRLLDTLVFIVRFTVLSVPLYLVLWLDPGMMPLQLAVAGHSASLLEAMGMAVARDGVFLTVGSGGPADTFTFFIGPDCIGWKSMVAYAALVLATLGVTMRKRLLGLAAGVPLIYLGNLARIAVVIAIERSHGLGAAMLFHDLLWQAGLIALVLLLWLAWLSSGRFRGLAVRIRDLKLTSR